MTKMPTRIVIIGAGGHGSVVWATIEEIKVNDQVSVTVMGWVDDSISGSKYGLPVIGKLDDIARISRLEPSLQFFVAEITKSVNP